MNHFIDVRNYLVFEFIISFYKIISVDRLRQLRAFVAVVEESGFAAAGRRLGVSPPTVTRLVSTLEDMLGVRLLERTTRHVHATDAGLRYLADVRRILGELEAADAAVAGVHGEPRGVLKVTAPVLFGQLHVVPGIVEFLTRYPETQVSALLLDRTVNLVEEGIDVGVRIGRLPDSSLRAQRVAEVRLVLCASPNYLRRHGTPTTPEHLREHTIIACPAAGTSNRWRFGHAAQARSVRVRPRLQVTSNAAALAAARRDFGITRALSYQVASSVKAGELTILMPEHEPRPHPVHLLHREGPHARTRVRYFLDMMATHLRSSPDLCRLGPS